MASYTSLTWALDAGFSTLRGISQFITSPLLALKVPFRQWVMPLISRKPFIEDNRSMRYLVARGKKAIKDDDGTTYAWVHYLLDEKLQKGKQQGQITHVKQTRTMQPQIYSDIVKWVSPSSKGYDQDGPDRQYAFFNKEKAPPYLDRFQQAIDASAANHQAVLSG